jgi:hypothetical protein
MYINDMAKISANSSHHLYLYADDSKIIHTINSLGDTLYLQNLLDKLVEWGTIWGMNFNPTKCFVMSFSRSKHKYTFKYNIKGYPLERVSSCMDLGILVTDNLRWNEHINHMVSKAGKRLGLVKRSLGFDCNTKVKLTCYNTLVRPILEYGSCVWSCHNKKLLLKVESIQRRGTKYIRNDYVNNYDTRLKSCNLLPLSYRRDLLDIIFCYNWYHGLNKANLSLSFVNTQEQRAHTRFAPDQLCLENTVCNTNLYSMFYGNRIVSTWNSIPLDIRNIELNENGKNTTFKKSIKIWLYSIYTNNFNCENTCTWKVNCRCILGLTA